MVSLSKPALRRSLGTPRLLVFLLLLLPVVAYSFSFPESTVGRTHLTRQYVSEQTTIAVGLDAPLGDPTYSGDYLHGYFGYAVNDWAEMGIAVRLAILDLTTGVDLGIDLVRAFRDASPYSVLLIGGGGWSRDNDRPFFYHGGLAAVWAVHELFQLYLGGGIDSMSLVPSAQAGMRVAGRRLGVSGDIKMFFGPDGLDAALGLLIQLCYEGTDEDSDDDTS